MRLRPPSRRPFVGPGSAARSCFLHHFGLATTRLPLAAPLRWCSTTRLNFAHRLARDCLTAARIGRRKRRANRKPSQNTPRTYLRALRAPVVIAPVLFRPRVRSDRGVVRPAPSPGSQVEARHRWERSIRRGRLPKPCRPRLTGGYSSYTDKNYVCPKSIDSGPRCPVSPLSDLCWWHAFGASQSGPRSSVLPPRVMPWRLWVVGSTK